MSDQERQPFRIRKMDGPPAPSPPPAPKKKPPQKPPPKAVTEPPPLQPGVQQTGGLFADANSALHFITAAASTGLADHPQVRHNAVTGQWWVQVDAPWDRTAALVSGARGRAFAGVEGRWGEVPVHGRMEGAPASSPPAREAPWSSGEVHRLLAHLRLHPGPFLDAPQAVVLTPGAMVQLVLRRALQQGIGVRMTPATCRPLSDDQSRAAALLHLSWHSEEPPRAFLEVISRLPYTLVARETGGGLSPAAGGTLLVDIRHRLPMGVDLLTGLVAGGELWFLGGEDVGHWRVTPAGGAVDGADLLFLPAAATPVELPATPPRVAPVPLRLVPVATQYAFPHAVLLDDDELEWLRRFLQGRTLPGGEELPYLIAGPGCHLLLAAGGLLARTPFGVPLQRHGREPLLVEEGWGFYPPLTGGARSRMFEMNEGSVLVVTRGREGQDMAVHRFSLERAMPIWSLWLPEPPPVAEGVDGEGAMRLRRLATLVEERRAKAEKPKEQPGLLKRLFSRPAPPEAEHDQIRRRAQAAENRGAWVEAAELLESVGDHARAGRLYERAARS